MPQTHVLLARHGQTEWSENGRHTGITDVPLTDEGRAQAAALAPLLAELDPALVLVSPRSRALDTAALAGLGDRAEVEPRLGEWEYGDYEGITSAAIHEDRPEWSIWDHGAPGGESPAQIASRVDGVIDRLAAADGLCVCFAHGHVLRVLAARWLGLEPAFGRYLALSTATLSGLGTEHGRRVITLWNEAPPGAVV